MAHGAAHVVTGKQFIYAVHAVWQSAGDGGVHGHIELVELDADKAIRYAITKSRAPGVKSTVVTRLEIGELGTRTPISWYVGGERFDMGDAQHDPRPGAELPAFLPEHPLPA